MKKYYFLSIALTLCISLTNAAQYDNTQAVVLAAGGSTRFKTGVSKLTIPFCGKPMVLHSLTMLAGLNIPITVVIGYQKELVEDIINSANIKKITFVEQTEQLGTGHAVLCSQPTWNSDNILIINGDMPLITADVIHNLVQAHNESGSAVSFVVSENTDPACSCGRIVHNENGIAIVEVKHFTQSVQEYPFINAGIYLIKREFLEQFLTSIQENEVTHEFYLTDLINLASINNARVTTVTAPFDTICGINDHRELADAERIKQNELINYWMKTGVRFNNPETVRIDVDVKIGVGTIIESGVHLLGSSEIGSFCHIKQFSTIENAILEDGAVVLENSSINNMLIEHHQQVGPFACISSYRTQTSLCPCSVYRNGTCCCEENCECRRSTTIVANPSLDEQYSKNFTDLLELICGPSCLSQGGTDSLKLMLEQESIETKKILDIGSGLGWVEFELAKHHNVDVVGIDRVSRMVDEANDRVKLHQLKGSVTFLHQPHETQLFQFDDNQFDIVFSKESLCHVHNKRALMKEIYRILRPGGKLIIMDWMTKDGTIAPQVKEMLTSDGLTLYLPAVDEYKNSIQRAGFINISMSQLNTHYVQYSKDNIATIKNMKKYIKQQFGLKMYDYAVDTFTKQKRIFKQEEIITELFKAEKPNNS